MKRNYGCEFISIIKEKWRESKMKEERIYRAIYHMRNSEYKCNTKLAWASQAALVVKNTPAKAGDLRATGSIPGSGRSLGGGHGNPLQYSCLGNLMNRGAWKAMVHSAAKSRTRLKWLSTQALKRHSIIQHIYGRLFCWSD